MGDELIAKRHRDALISQLANDRWRALLLPLCDPEKRVRDQVHIELQTVLRETPRSESD